MRCIRLKTFHSASASANSITAPASHEQKSASYLALRSSPASICLIIWIAMCWPRWCRRSRTGLGCSDGEIGWLTSAFMIGYFATAPIFGYLGDRGRARGLSHSA